MEDVVKQVLLIIDAQEGYLSQINNGQEASVRTSRLKELLESNTFQLKIATLDWFPKGSHAEGKIPSMQKSESAFCIRETKGAEFINSLDIDLVNYFIFKGKIDLTKGLYTQGVVKKILDHIRYVFNLKADDVSSFQITLCGIGRHGVIRDTSEALINQGVSIQIDVDGCPFKEVFSIEHAKGRWKKVGITISNDEVDIQTSKRFPANNENTQKRAYI